MARRLIQAWLAVLVLVSASTSGQAADPDAKFPLRDGDVWVMAGDSITAQHLHSNYFEAFCFARYPQIKFAFRNSGVGGHTIPTTLARFQYDVAAWKPTVVSVELGMNDAGGTSKEAFLANMQTWLEKVRSIQARPVIFSPSPVNDGSLLGKLAPQNRNVRLDEYSTGLKELAAREQIPYADQFHALIDIWGHNKPREKLRNFVVSAEEFAADDSVAGVDQLRAFLKAQREQKDPPISMTGDPVHPGPAGQLMMAAALLKELGAEGFVSSIVMDAEGKNVTAKGCRVSGVSAGNGTLSFERLDESLPFPVPAAAVPVLPLTPTLFELSKYTLQVNGLADGKYAVKINDVVVAQLTHVQLSQGVNLTAYGPELLPVKENPIAVQGTEILDAVQAKEAIVGEWRNLSRRVHGQDAAASGQAELLSQLEALSRKVEEADARIREVSTPRKLNIEISRIP